MCDHGVCQDTDGALTIATLLDDPLTRLVMRSDGISPQDMLALLTHARATVLQHERDAAPRP
jgi:hypothetical protein